MSNEEKMKNHLMHPRLAHNYARNGYFPTDDETLDMILERLDAIQSNIRIFDACCGEGHALHYLALRLINDNFNVETHGIELDKERAIEANSILTRVIQSDIENCLFKPKMVGLLFLNPPYGYKTKDSLANDKAERLEEMFFGKTFGTLQTNGVLILVIPEQSLTKKFAMLLGSKLVNLTIFKAGVDTFRQVVIIGNRPDSRDYIRKAIVDKQVDLIMSAAEPGFKEYDVGYTYSIPKTPEAKFKPISFVIDGCTLQAEIKEQHSKTMWGSFNTIFSNRQGLLKRRPLCKLGSWHAALALAAGQVNGIMESESGRKLLVKGTTYKVKDRNQTVELDRNDNEVCVEIAIDRFVPSIKAIELTPNENFGEIWTIK